MARYEKQKWRLWRTKKISNHWKSQRTNWSQWVVPKSSLGIRCLFALLPKFEICAETRLQLFETFIPWLFEKVLFCDTSCFFLHGHSFVKLCPEILIRVSTGILVGKASCLQDPRFSRLFSTIGQVFIFYWSATKWLVK